MTTENPLPPGQYEYPSFDRFGLGLFAGRFPENTHGINIKIAGNVGKSLDLNNTLLNDKIAEVPRVEQVSDFHCVTTWSVRGQTWSGFRFADIYHQIIVPQAQPEANNHFVVFRGQDNYACAMTLEDLLADDVLLADSLNGKPLGVDHGAPVRLLAPAHYGYKSVKHIHTIEFWQDSSHYRFPQPYPNLMNHPRARVAFEERAKYLPLWIVRPLYKLLMPFARRKHAKKLRAYEKNQPR